MYGGFIPTISEQGMTSGIKAMLAVGRQPSKNSRPYSHFLVL
jgi:hypothetical protein